LVKRNFPYIRFVKTDVGQHTKASRKNSTFVFLPTQEPTLKKPKELFSANAREK